MILCAGEALIDMIPTATVTGQTGYVPHVGGSVLNTAVALGRLGAPVALLTGLSSDRFGQRIEAALAASHVSTEPSLRSARPTTLAFVHLDDGQASYQFYDENSAFQQLGETALPALPANLRAGFFGGISLCEPSVGDALAALARVAAIHVPVMIDPNVRPGLARDPERYRARLAAMLASSDIVKVSQEDLDWLMPGTEAADLLAHGPRLVLLTRGAEGADAWHANGAHRQVPAPAVTVADTVGAGDTFNAAVLFDLDRNGLLDRDGIGALTGADLERMLTLATRAAAITVTRSGANPPWKEDLA